MKKASQKGFTLVELLIVVAMLGALVAVTYSIINQQQQRKRAADAVNRSKLEQLSQAIESYMATEGKYPTASSGAPSGASMGEYIPTWPTGFTYVVDAARTEFAIYISASNGNYLKYGSSWGGIKFCTSASISQVTVCTDAGN